MAEIEAQFQPVEAFDDEQLARALQEQEDEAFARAIEEAEKRDQQKSRKSPTAAEGYFGEERRGGVSGVVVRVPEKIANKNKYSDEYYDFDEDYDEKQDNNNTEDADEHAAKEVPDLYEDAVYDSNYLEFDGRSGLINFTAIQEGQATTTSSMMNNDMVSNRIKVYGKARRYIKQKHFQDIR
eukprot:GEZU01027989.1.p1 GENE.GEZU01027989.1~~GEZU01027989.1.p1  ORF type:complete len:182 (+),score=72.07 GEZU01027989.1:131-676(+)